MTKESPSAWTVAGVVVSAVLAIAVIGDRFWGGKSDSNVTSYQVTQLTEAVKNLAGKFDGLAKQSSVDALSSKVDVIGNDMIGAKHDIQDLQGSNKDLRTDVNGLIRPQFRNPKN